MTDFQSDLSTFRILDAAINRASEGIRVVEDFARMALDDSFLAKSLKQLRHELHSATMPLDTTQRVTARDSQRDVGRTIRIETEYQRVDERSVVQANLSRAAQALRTIEEFSKTIQPQVATQVEQLRYQVYSLEKAILNTKHSIESLEGMQLYVLVNGMGSPEQLRGTTQALVQAGVDMIQLRDKRLGDRELVVAGKVLSQATQGSSARWIMNDRCDLAIAAGADGVHLGQDDLSVADARQIVGPEKLVGISTHSLQQAKQAVLDGASYIGIGPVFPSRTKSFEDYVGTDLVAEVIREVQLPTFAIGGIELNNIESLTSVGCDRVAVSSAIIRNDDPVNVAEQFKVALTKSASV